MDTGRPTWKQQKNVSWSNARVANQGRVVLARRRECSLAPLPHDFGLLRRRQLASSLQRSLSDHTSLGRNSRGPSSDARRVIHLHYRAQQNEQ